MVLGTHPVDFKLEGTLFIYSYRTVVIYYDLTETCCGSSNFEFGYYGSYYVSYGDLLWVPDEWEFHPYYYCQDAETGGSYCDYYRSVYYSANVVSLFVPATASFSVSGADEIGWPAPGRIVYATHVLADNDVVIELSVSPSGAPVSWSGGAEGANQYQRIVSRSSLIEGGVDMTASICSGEVFNGKIYVFRALPSPATVTHDTTVVQNASPGPDEFGTAEFTNALTANNSYLIGYSSRKWKFVFQSTSYEIRWGMHSLQRTDVPNPAANPFPVGLNMAFDSSESEKRNQAWSDLVPDGGGFTSRYRYWSSAMVEQHELFHVNDFRNVFYPPRLAEAESWIESHEVTVELSNLDPDYALSLQQPSFESKVSEKAAEAGQDFLPGVETRAYADGRAGYQNLAGAILP